VEGDISDEHLVRRTLERYRIETVIHFAANAYVGESILDPRKYFHNNVTNSLSLLHSLMDGGINKIVFSSTCATYGRPQQVPISEGHPQSPVNPYGESKLFIEKTLRWYSEAHALRSVCLRYFNAAGADPQGELGESHHPETHLIPCVIQAALGDRSHVDLFGTDYPTHDGTAIRDYIHVSDLASAHIRAVRYLLDNGQTTAVNLGTGRGYSVRDVISSVQRVTGRRVPVAERHRRKGDPEILVAAAGRACDLFGWTPRFTDLDEIVETAFAWHARQPRLASAAV
jgi:UDP-glucose-4-epimerase GalE